jgi:hypothetical protein
MKQTLIDIQVEYDEPIPIYCDNTRAISISKKSDDALQDKSHSQSSITFYENRLQKTTSELSMWAQKEQVADIFTKPLPREAFEYLHQRLEVISTPK